MEKLKSNEALLERLYTYLLKEILKNRNRSDPILGPSPKMGD